MNSILYTSNHGKLIKNSMGSNPMTEDETDYTKMIKEYFYPYREHEIYHLIEQMTVNGFYLGLPMELMCSVGELPLLNRKYSISPLCTQLSGREETINTLLHTLRDFSLKSNYLSFFEHVSNYYSKSLEIANKHIRKLPYISVMEEFFGKKQNSYRYIITNLSHGSFGISFFDNDKLDMFNIMCMLRTFHNAEENELSRGALSTNVTLHEFAHPIINPLTEKSNELVKDKIQAYEWLEPYKLPNYQSGYGDWNECVNEHMVRAITIYLAKKLGEQEYAYKYLEYDMNLGYRYLPALLNKLEYYENNRDTYNMIDDFYPMLLEVFSEKF